MVPSRFPRPVRLGLYALAVLILLVLCVLPNKDLPDPGTGDRFEHTAAWFILTVTGYVLAPNRRIAIPAGRHSDPLDFVADVQGVALAVGLYLVVRWYTGRTARA